MNKTDKAKANQLADALIEEALQADNLVDLFHALERMEKGINAIQTYVNVKEQLDK